MKRNYTLRLYVFLWMLFAAGACSAQGEVAMDNEADAESITDATHIFAPVYHQVIQGETVKSIMQQFGMNQYQFNKWNSLPNGLKPGQNVVVKYHWCKRSDFDMSTLPATTPAHQAFKPLNTAGTASVTSNAANITYHRVAPHETLYSLSAQYHVPVEKLKTWNNLNDNKIKANINLIVGM